MTTTYRITNGKHIPVPVDWYRRGKRDHQFGYPPFAPDGDERITDRNRDYWAGYHDGELAND